MTPRMHRLWTARKSAILAILLGSASGCMSFVSPVDAPGPELVESCKEIPRAARDHVYLFFINGVDPLDWANLDGVRDYCRALGFQRAYYGQLYHTGYFKREIQRIHEQDPEARFVLIGFSFGANEVRNLAHAAREAGATIDLLVYCGGNTLDNTPDDQPENALVIINVLAKGCIWNGAQMDRAENVSVEDVYHFGSPSHPRTLRLLSAHLAAIAGTVAVPVPPAAIPRADEPLPRAATRHTAAKPSESALPAAPGATSSEEWDFLKPVQHLHMPAPFPTK